EQIHASHQNQSPARKTPPDSDTALPTSPARPARAQPRRSRNPPTAASSPRVRKAGPPSSGATSEPLRKRKRTRRSPAGGNAAVDVFRAVESSNAMVDA